MAVTSFPYLLERLGRPLSKLGQCGTNGIIIYTFGHESTEVTTCAVTDTVLSSDDMALVSCDNAYITAQYRGMPDKTGFKLSSVETKKPIISA